MALSVRQRRFCSRACGLNVNRCKREQPMRGNTYVIEGPTARMLVQPRTGDPIVVTVDADDVDALRRWTWRFNRRHGRIQGRTRGSRESYHLARVIMDAPPSLDVDHVNGDPLDNRRGNLRLATKRENAQNRTRPYARKKSGLPRGVTVVTRSLSHPFRANGRLHGKTIYLGYFRTVEEADAAARAWRAEHMPFSAEGDGRAK